MKKLLLILIAAYLPCVASAADMSVAAGNAHTILLKNDGTVWTWGTYYDFGTVKIFESRIAIQIEIDNAADIASGYSHGLLLKKDGTVWAYGKNSTGQLGNGTKTNTQTPVQANISNVSKIAAGHYHSIAFQGNDKTILIWGNNIESQLGYSSSDTCGSTPCQTTPHQVFLNADITAIAAGYGHNVALANGTMQSWGYNIYGQIGDGTKTKQPIPVDVKSSAGLNFNNVRAVGAGYNHSFAVKNDTTLWAWGKNTTGQLGNGSITDSIYPVKVTLSDNSDFYDIRAIAGGENHSLALKNDGTVWAWGDNSKGQLGDGSTTQHKNPVQIQNPDQVVFIAAGANHSLAIRNDGTVWAWGDNSSGQLGGNITEKYRSSPVQIFKPGDLNMDTKIDLKDAILSLQVLADLVPSETVYPVSEVSGDAKIGLEETVYILQMLSGLR
jgi:alpha-tubulin suppressor-like RCC1 family protein